MLIDLVSNFIEDHLKTCNTLAKFFFFLRVKVWDNSEGNLSYRTVYSGIAVPLHRGAVLKKKHDS